MNKLHIILILLSVFSICTCKKDDPAPANKNVVVYAPKTISKTNACQVFVHFMPWFEDKATSDNGKWGQHWTMNTQNPDITDATGKRQIASYFYPLIGPYASSNPDVLEYHLLLMKYSGIDGILIDWYGVQQINDYPLNNRNTQALINMLGKVGLKFALVYEDRTIKAALDKGAITDDIVAAQDDMAFIEKNYFSMNEYIKIDDKPLLLVFGPEYFHKASQWTEVLANLSTKPCFLTLNGTSSQTAPNSSGEYIWVDANSLDSKYKTKNNFDVFIGGAYPGFKDFYTAGGWGQSYNLPYPHNNGALLEANLNKAKIENVDYLQLITWNDFGEGTMIEPTQEFGFTMLEKIQNFAGTTYTATELEHIYDLYKLRVALKTNGEAQKSLTQAFYYLVSIQSEKALNVIDSLKTIK